MTSAPEKFREPVKPLHRRKDAAYRDAWKKRGEVLGIVSNIARKVDRIECVLDGAPSISDESLFHTAVDLLVYCLKCETYLADHDTSVAEMLLGQHETEGSYIDEPEGFEYLLCRLNFAELETENTTAADPGKRISTQLHELELCFSGVNASESVSRRLARLEDLIRSCVRFIATLKRENDLAFQRFVGLQLRGSSNAS